MNRLENDNFDDGKIINIDEPMMFHVAKDNLLQVVWQRRWIVMLAALLCLGVAFVYLHKATPIYTSTSRVYVEQRGPKIITEQQGLMTQSKNYLYTQRGLITSTPILAGVTTRPDILQMKTFAEVDRPLAFLRKKLDVKVGKKDDIIAISFDSPYPEEAAQLVNVVVDSYTNYHSTSQRSTVGEILRILQKEKSRRDAEINDQYLKILEFKKENSILALEDHRGNIVLHDLTGIIEALTEARIKAIDAKASYEAAKTMLTDPAGRAIFIEAQRANSNYNVFTREENRLRADLNQLQIQLTGMKSTFTQAHPSIKAVEVKITELQKQLAEQEEKASEAYLESFRKDWIISQQKEGELQVALDQERAISQDLSVKVFQHAMLRSELDRTKNLSAVIDSRIEELNVTEDSGALNISILEIARPADLPSKPQKAFVLAIALVGGMFFGVGLALVGDFKDHRLRSADEIIAILGVPVLGTVPSIPGKKDIALHGRKAHNDPSSDIAEAYKNIRTAVYFSVPNGSAKTLLITSPSPGDGKTTLASNLATTMAQAGQRTLVIDCNFRKPNQHNVLNVEQKTGLSCVLSGEEELEKVIKSTNRKNLNVLPSGPIPDNPSELLSSRAFAEVIARLSRSYDRILIDSPSVMHVTDARILGSMCDGTIVVLRAEKSTREDIAQARDSLLSVGTNILGVVVNDVNARKNRYDYERIYSYGFGHSRVNRETYGLAKPGLETIAIDCERRLHKPTGA